MAEPLWFVCVCARICMCACLRTCVRVYVSEEARAAAGVQTGLEKDRAGAVV